MDGLLTENVKVIIYWLTIFEYVRKGSQGDHIIPFQKNNVIISKITAIFHTEVVGEKFCQLQGSEWPLMASVQTQVFLT